MLIEGVIHSEGRMNCHALLLYICTRINKGTNDRNDMEKIRVFLDETDEFRIERIVLKNKISQL